MDALDDIKFYSICILGEGTFGQVHMCRSYIGSDPKYVCVKRIIRTNPKCDINMIIEEVRINSQIQHPNIVQFLRYFLDKDAVNIVMEYVDGGTMRKIIKKARRVAITVSSLKRYFCDILMGLEYLHIRKIIHRDLKPENLLLTSERHVKIADFGIASIYRPHNVEDFKILGTPFYLAPEVMHGTCCDFKSDIWSLGCVLFEMCEALHPFREAKTFEALQKLIIKRTQNDITEDTSIVNNYGNVFGKLCKEMLIYDAHKRIALPDILRLDGTLTIPFYNKYFDYDY